MSGANNVHSCQHSPLAVSLLPFSLPNGVTVPLPPPPPPLPSSTSASSLLTHHPTIDPSLAQAHALINQFLVSSYQSLLFKQHHEKSTNPYFSCPPPSSSTPAAVANGEYKFFPHNFFNTISPTIAASFSSSASSSKSSNSSSSASLAASAKPQTSSISRDDFLDDESLSLLNGVSNSELEKSLIYQHRFFPLLKFMFEKVEEATKNPELLSHNVVTGTFIPNGSKQHENKLSHDHVDIDREIGSFFLENQHLFLASSRTEVYSTNENVARVQFNLDNLMANAILVLRIHLLELEKVNELCRDFAERYIEALKIKLNSDNIFKIDDDEDDGGEEEANGSDNEAADPSGEDGGDKKKRKTSAKASAKKKRKKQLNSQTSVQMARKETPSGSSGSNHVDGGSGKYHINPETSMSSISLRNLRASRSFASLDAKIGYDSPGHRSQITSESISDDFEAVAAVAARKSGSKHELDESTGDEDVFDDDDDDDEEITIDDDDDDGKSSTQAGKSSSGGGDDSRREEGGKDASKLKRGILPKSATNVMKKWLFQHLVHPYPSEEEKKQIATKTNLTLIQVNNWFINARRRILQPMLEASNPDLTKKKKPSQSSASKPYQNNRYWPPSLSNMKMSSNESSSSPSSQPTSTSIKSGNLSSSSKSAASSSSSKSESNNEDSPAKTAPSKPEVSQTAVNGGHHQLASAFNQLDQNSRTFELESSKLLLDHYHQHLLKTSGVNNSSAFSSVLASFANHNSASFFFPGSSFQPGNFGGLETTGFTRPELLANGALLAAPGLDGKKEKKPYSAFKIENLLNNNSDAKTQNSSAQAPAISFDSSRFYLPFAQSPNFRACFQAHPPFYQP